MTRFAIALCLLAAFGAQTFAASAPFKPLPGFKPSFDHHPGFSLKPHHPPVVKPVAAPAKPPLLPSRPEGTMAKYVGPAVLGFTFCGATSLWVSAYVKDQVHHQGQLTMREAHKAVWNCAIPFVGGWLVDRAWDANPQWVR